MLKDILPPSFSSNEEDKERKKERKEERKTGIVPLPAPVHAHPSERKKGSLTKKRRDRQGACS
jgi:hypothetical protein